jgi:hypothetical protein
MPQYILVRSVLISAEEALREESAGMEKIAAGTESVSCDLPCTHIRTVTSMPITHLFFFFMALRKIYSSVHSGSLKRYIMPCRPGLEKTP